MTLRAAILLILVSLPALADDPILVVNSGGHTGTVKSVLFAAKGKYLVSAGEDKVIRIWEVATGKNLRTLRGQIGDGLDGKIYALALSPDGNSLAVGGYLRRTQGGTYIRVLNFTTGEVEAVLVGHSDVVSALAFSPAGRFLASASVDGTVRLWDLTRKGDATVLDASAGPVSTIAFSPDGARLASGGVDKKIRLWDARAARLLSTLEGHKDQISSLAFTSDGRFLLSSAEDTELRRWDVRTGKLASSLGNQGTNGGNLVMAPGNRFLTSSSYKQGAKVQFAAEMRRLDDGRVLTSFPKHERDISASALSPDGAIAATAGGYRNEIHLWNAANGSLIRTIVGAGRPVFTVGFAADGNSIAYGNALQPNPAPNAYGSLDSTIIIREGTRYDIHPGLAANRSTSRYLTADDTVDGRQLRVSAGRVGALAKLEVLRGGRTTAVIERDERSGYLHSAFTLTHDGRYVITGGFGGILTVFDSDTGRKAGDLVGHTGDIWSVAVSRDNSLLVTGSDDQTVRLWDLVNYRNLLTMFLPEDGQWVAWTPQGYYTCNRNGDRYIGWHINNGADHPADWFAADRFVAEFFKPPIVSRFLELHNIQSAIAKVNAAVPAAEKEPERNSKTVAALLPPIVMIETPAAREETRTSDRTFSLKARARSLTPIKGWIVTVNNKKELEQKVAGSLTDATLDARLTLSPGPNTIAVFADNGKTESDTRLIQVDGAVIPQDKPALAVLAIGLSTYGNKSVKLDYGDKDAKAIAEKFQSQKGTFYSDVKVQTLVNQDATRVKIMGGLDWLSKPATAGPNDIRVVFFAGHAAAVDDRGYIFWSYDHNPQDTAQALDVASYDINGLLNRIQGRTVLIIDTCNAAALVRPGTRGVRPDELTQVFKQAATPGLTLMLYAASAPNESAREGPQYGGGHGALTAAVLDALSPDKTRRSRTVTTKEMADLVEAEVRKTTNDSQRVYADLEPLNARHFEFFRLP